MDKGHTWHLAHFLWSVHHRRTSLLSVHKCSHFCSPSTYHVTMTTTHYWPPPPSCQDPSKTIIKVLICNKLIALHLTHSIHANINHCQSNQNNLNLKHGNGYQLASHNTFSNKTWQVHISCHCISIQQQIPHGSPAIHHSPHHA